MMGDFNDINNGEDRWGGGQPNLSRLNDFQYCLGLRDINYTGLMYTWHNGQQFRRSVFQRLDKALANNNWNLMFPNARLRHLPRYSSDHNPIVLEFNLSTNKYNNSFNKF